MCRSIISLKLIIKMTSRLRLNLHKYFIILNKLILLVLLVLSVLLVLGLVLIHIDTTLAIIISPFPSPPFHIYTS